MTVPAEVLAQRLESVREATVTALLRAQAIAIDAGAEIEAEPMRRDAQNRIRRDGPLDLPSRGDLGVTHGGRTLVRQIEGGTGPDFEPFEAFVSPDFAAAIHPFAWDHAVLEMTSRQDTPNWTPLRHWFLEWFQVRPSEISPELSGAVHRLDGPYRGPDDWRATVDFGSAPASCIPALIAAVALSGCSTLVIGSD